ncbi:hypothetical protein B0T25DRAFT_533531 [Lasiosphaeria hispida]|uniref:Uncharacterized protein n=1 Tax=Lasiosphaeria hispida TaxID=260671 RepID=A0AAJ0MHV1_9PEZI|nr:hypothetical protein B0T25DRAFT_533531 [Lasiosphaeria hispida]
MAPFRVSVLLALLAAVVVQAIVPEVDYASPAALVHRQAPGTPQYACHESCGNALAAGRAEGHCENSTWVGYYEACLDCALDFDIWKYYEKGVTAAASPCSLTPTPSPSGPASAPSSITGGVPSITTNPSAIAPSTTPPITSSSATGSVAGVTSSTVTAGAPVLGVATELLSGVCPLLFAFLGAAGVW